MQAEAYMKQQAASFRGDGPATEPRRPAGRRLPPAAPDVQESPAGYLPPAAGGAVPARAGHPAPAQAPGMAAHAAPAPAAPRVAPAAALVRQRADDLWKALESFAAAAGHDARLGRPARIISLFEQALGEVDAFLQEAAQQR
jgi:hypothetical protein